MLNEFYDFIAKRIFSYFQVQSDLGILQPAESFCLKLDDEDMVQEVKISLEKILEENHSKGLYEYLCMDGTFFQTFTLCTKEMEIIVAAQDENMTSDFLGASLRNAANENQMPLLMITANPIDSALSGSRSMSSAGMPFNSEKLISEIKRMITDSTKLTSVEKEILRFELGRREDDVFSDKSALYEYREFLAIMSTGSIDESIFPEFRLFYVDGKKDLIELSESQIKKEIKKNHDQFEKIDRSVRFGNIEVDLSVDFDDKFIKRLVIEKNKNTDQWSRLFTYNEVMKAMEKIKDKKDNPLQIDKRNITAYRDIPLNPYSDDVELFIRDEGSQKAKKRTKNILLFNSDRYQEITLRIDCNIHIPNSGILNESESFERDHNSLIFKFQEDQLIFRKIQIEDEINKIKYIFKVCIIGISPQYLMPTIKTNYIILYKKTKKNCKIKLLGAGTDLSFNQVGEEVVSKKLIDNQAYACDYKTRLNLYSSEEELANYGNGINISISFANVSVPFLIVPDESRSQEITGRRILRDKFSYQDNFTFSGDFQIQRDSQEYFVKENLKRELHLENYIIKNKVIAGSVNEFHEEPSPFINISDVVISRELQSAYFDFLEAFNQLETTPTLAYIGSEILKESAAKYVEVFIEQFAELEDRQTLTLEQQNSLLLGTLTIGENADEIILTPFHPLNIAYQMTLLNESGFEQTADVIVDRLNSLYLLPYIQRKKKVYKVSDQMFSMEWKYYAPVENRKYMGGRKYIPKLIEDKVSEFTGHFKYIFEEINNRKIKLNLINMGDCSEVLQGIAQYYSHTIKKMPDIEKLLKFEIHVYTENFFENAFNYLKNLSELKQFLDKAKLSIDSGTAMSDLEGILAKKVRCYFHKDNGKDYEYAHISFFEMESEITSEMAAMDQIDTGTSLGGLLSGVPSNRYGVNYRTGFGSKYAKKTKLVQIAELFNSLSQVSDSGNPYQRGVAISTQIDSNAEKKMEDIYASSNWVVFVDPKVDLDFFCEKESSSDLLIIHYSDQYTTSSGYDAITVTQKSKQYAKVIHEYLTEKGMEATSAEIAQVIHLFNAVNGDWLLRLVSSKRSAGINKESIFSREKISIVAAIKLMLAYLKHPDILWVPISMEEMLRVSGGAGLSQKEGILSAKNLGFEKGPTSDDILFIGLHKKDDILNVYFYPTEVKTGYNPNPVIDKAFIQASKTADGLQNALNPENENIGEISYKINRNFMMQLLINSCKKMQVYHVDDTQDWKFALDKCREQLLNEDYVISDDIQKVIGKGAVLSFKKELIKKKTSFKEDVINFIEVPEQDEYEFILKSVEEIALDINGLDSGLIPLNKVNISELNGDTSKLYERDTEKSDTQASKEVMDGLDGNNISDNTEEDQTIEEDDDNANKLGKDLGIRIQFGKDRLDASAIFWEPNDTDQIFHTNTGIIGTMGTGKTQFTKSLITQLCQEQEKNVDSTPIGILIFDYKGDYNESKEDFVKATQANVLKLYHLPFNPLALTKSATFKPLLPIHTANAFKDTLSKVYGLGPKQQDALFQCILDAYHQMGIEDANPDTWDKNAPTFENVYQIYAQNEEIKKTDSLAAAMNKLHQFQIFESDTNNTKSLFNLLQGVTVIDVSGYDSDIQSLVIAITLDLFYSQMQAAGSSKLEGKYRQLTKIILVDEADNFMSQGFPSLKKILKEGREFGVGTILSTQFLKHFGTGDDDYAKYILTWVVHNVADLKPSDVDFVFNTTSKSEEEQKLFNDIKTLQKHNSIIKIGTGKPVYMEDLAFWQLIKRERP